MLRFVFPILEVLPLLRTWSSPEKAAQCFPVILIAFALLHVDVEGIAFSPPAGLAAGNLQQLLRAPIPSMLG